MKSVILIKKISTVLDTIGMCQVAISIPVTIYMLIRIAVLTSDGTSSLQNAPLNDSMGGVSVLGLIFAVFGSVLTLIAVSSALISVIVQFALFAVSSINGIILLKNTGKYMSMGTDIYLKKARRDSVIKLICGAVLCLYFILIMIQSHTINLYNIVVIAFCAVICILEIKALNLINSQEQTS